MRSFGAAVGPLKKKRDAADAGVGEVPIDNAPAITLILTTFHTAGFDTDASQDDQHCARLKHDERHG